MQLRQEIILSYYRNGDSIRKISRELGINRKTVTRYINAYESQRKKLEATSGDSQVEIIDDLVKAPRYNSQNRGKRKLSLALSQIDSRLDKIYKMYYKHREKHFIELIQYVRDCSIPIKKIELAIKQLRPVKATDVTIDKIKILCERQVEQPLMVRHDENQIDKICQDQLKILTRLIPDNNKLSQELVEVK